MQLEPFDPLGSYLNALHMARNMWGQPERATYAGQPMYEPEPLAFGGVEPMPAPLGDTANWLVYENQNATRSLPLNPELVNALAFVPELGLKMHVISGGQPSSGPNRLGSRRHDHGMSVDADFYFDDGTKLDWNNPAHMPIIETLITRAVENDITGIGAGDDYMGAGRFHMGFGQPAVWGAGGKGENAPNWLRRYYYGA